MPAKLIWRIVIALNSSIIFRILIYFAIPLLKSGKGLFIVEVHSAYPASSQALHWNNSETNNANRTSQAKD